LIYNRQVTVLLYTISKLYMAPSDRTTEIEYFIF
jgi:hypothetical protein